MDEIGKDQGHLWGIENGESWEVDWIKKIKNI
jgi:hypothetical protein